jgi:hypothetical protein
MSHLKELTMKHLIEIDGTYFHQDEYGGIRPCIDNIPRFKRKGGKPFPLLIITVDWLCNYYSISRATYYRWVQSNKLIPNDIESIVKLKQTLLSRDK